MFVNDLSREFRWVITAKILIGLIYITFAQENNVCRTFQDYKNTKNNPNCYYNYAVGKLVPTVLTQGGLPFEQHKVTTKDGYILTLHRIPNSNHPKKKKTVMFLQHGLITNSGNFVALLNDSMAFMLANIGYDVWMGNYRGNQYSVEHVNMTVYDPKFWDYCADELGTKDLPAMLQYVDDITKANGDLIYVGHSLGGTMALMFASDLPHQAKKLVKLFILMAPAHLLPHQKGPLILLKPFLHTIYSFIINMDLIRIVSHSDVTLKLAKMVCMGSSKLMQYCTESLSLAYGPTAHILPETWPIFFDHHPAGTSLKVVKQLVNFMEYFTKYDYGFNNIFIYNQINAPEYNLTNINVPMHIMTSDGDWTTPITDAIHLHQVLPTSAKYGIHKIPVEHFNHIGFFYSKYTKNLVNDYLLNFISEFNRNGHNV